MYMHVYIPYQHTLVCMPFLSQQKGIYTCTYYIYMPFLSQQKGIYTCTYYIYIYTHTYTRNTPIYTSIHAPLRIFLCTCICTHVHAIHQHTLVYMQGHIPLYHKALIYRSGIEYFFIQHLVSLFAAVYLCVTVVCNDSMHMHTYIHTSIHTRMYMQCICG
jgi:hypothetical protein